MAAKIKREADILCPPPRFISFLNDFLNMPIPFQIPNIRFDSTITLPLRLFKPT